MRHSVPFGRALGTAGAVCATTSASSAPLSSTYSVALGHSLRLSKASRALPSRSLERDMTTSGGLLDTTLSDVIGARLCCPCWSVWRPAPAGGATTWRSRDGRGVRSSSSMWNACHSSGAASFGQVTVALSANQASRRPVLPCPGRTRCGRGTFPTVASSPRSASLDGRGRIGDAALKNAETVRRASSLRPSLRVPVRASASPRVLGTHVVARPAKVPQVRSRRSNEQPMYPSRSSSSSARVKGLVQASVLVEKEREIEVLLGGEVVVERACPWTRPTRRRIPCSAGPCCP